MEPHWLTNEEIKSLPPGAFVYPHSPDSVAKYGDFFYYWDEVWANCYGPFDTESNCRFALMEYAVTL